MRERYNSNGGQLRLSAESKNTLNLVDPSQWQLDNLVIIQPHVLAPLLNYWLVPRRSRRPLVTV